jgi:hypothetical protein
VSAALETRPSATDPRLRERLKINLDSVRRVGKKHLVDELYLSTTKWCDYRFMTPAESTELFKREYIHRYKLTWRECVDVYESELKTGVMSKKHDKLLRTQNDLTNERREYTSLWAARQNADALGMPYDFYIREAMRAHMANGYRKPPRPNQLAAGPTQEKVTLHILDRWEEWVDNSFTKVISHLPQYMNPSYCNLPAQNAHHEWVADRLREGRPLNVGLACYVHQVLPEERAAVKYGAERLLRARDEVAGLEKVQAIKVEAADLWPSCFALPLVFDPGSPICSACREKDLCGRIDDGARRKFQDRHGDSDPEAARVREQNRQRQRRRRERLKVARATGPGSSPPRPSGTTAV